MEIALSTSISKFVAVQAGEGPNPETYIDGALWFDDPHGTNIGLLTGVL